MSTIVNPEQTGDFNSLLLIGGLSVAIVGGLTLYFIKKPSEDERKVLAQKESDDLITTSTLYQNDKRKRKNKKKEIELPHQNKSTPSTEYADESTKDNKPLLEELLTKESPLEKKEESKPKTNNESSPVNEVSPSQKKKKKAKKPKVKEIEQPEIKEIKNQQNEEEDDNENEWVEINKKKKGNANEYKERLKQIQKEHDDYLKQF